MAMAGRRKRWCALAGAVVAALAGVAAGPSGPAGKGVMGIGLGGAGLGGTSTGAGVTGAATGGSAKGKSAAEPAPTPSPSPGGKGAKTAKAVASAAPAKAGGAAAAAKPQASAAPAKAGGAAAAAKPQASAAPAKAATAAPAKAAAPGVAAPAKVSAAPAKAAGPKSATGAPAKATAGKTGAAKPAIGADASGESEPPEGPLPKAPPPPRPPVVNTIHGTTRGFTNTEPTWSAGVQIGNGGASGVAAQKVGLGPGALALALGPAWSSFALSIDYVFLTDTDFALVSLPTYNLQRGQVLAYVGGGVAISDGIALRVPLGAQYTMLRDPFTFYGGVTPIYGRFYREGRLRVELWAVIGGRLLL
jgi:hypothetical protein